MDSYTGAEMAEINYPFRARTDAISIADRGVLEKLFTWYETLKVERRERRRAISVSLRCVSHHGQTSLYPDELPLVFLTRNDAKLVPAFLTHYRQLGVTRFICVDDASTDGTREFLLEQEDVDLWVSPVRYKDARRGRAWRETLFSLYGGQRWYVNVDSDEFLVYDGFETQTLWPVLHCLEKVGALRLPAPMLDMYPVGLSQADANLLSSRAPWEIADHLDSSGYTLSTTNRAISIKGGARKRKFDADLELIKYPLIYWDDDCRFGPSIHQPLPYRRNFASIMGALLRFDFFSDRENETREAAGRERYFDNTPAYAKITDVIAEIKTLKPQSGASVKFTGSQQLRDLGLITPIAPNESGG